MTKQEQIEEMAKIIQHKEEIYSCEDDVHCENCFCSHKDTAEKLYNAGYRKAEEVRKETLNLITEQEKKIDGLKAENARLTLWIIRNI